MTNQRTRIAIVGLGAIGKQLARELSESEHYELTAVAGRDAQKTRGILDNLGLEQIPVVAPESVVDHADLIFDAAPADALRSFAEPVIRAGKELVVISVGALLENADLIERAKETGAVIHIPSGALMGLDGVQAAAQGEIFSSKIVIHKPANALPADE